MPVVKPESKIIQTTLFEENTESESTVEKGSWFAPQF